MRNLTLIYILALTIIALVIGFSQYLVQQSISTSIYDAHTINLSGRQSMLAQKITKAALAMETAQSESEFNASKAELVEASQLWETSHNALQYGNDQLGLDNVNNSETIFLLFLDLEQYYTAMQGAINNIEQLAFGEQETQEKLLAAVDKLLANEADYQQIMDKITLNYDEESTARLIELSETEYALLAVALILLLLEAILIFRPAINQINQYTTELIDKEKSLELALEEQKKEKAKVEFLNRQAESVFDNVGQGLFLLDENHTISELYSKALEDIFEEKELAGTHFVQLMRPRLVKRDQEALEMFMKHLFNAEIEEEVLQQLNPVDQVEIYSNEPGNANIDSRFIRTSFSRILDGDQIIAILVTVTDETETILMQQRIAESEEKNRRESQQLLSILRVDPIVLRDFLDTAKSDLRSISDRYEQDKSQDFKSLISYTFNTIHNLKGNASLIDLELVAERLHEIENIITELRDKTNLQGRDFLKILYEINDLTLIVMNMQRMLLRIAEVNTKMADGETRPESNEGLVSMLQKGLLKLNQELGKDSELIFEDNGLVLPERYKLAIKDTAIQLFRNSLVHGIESSAERTAQGKSAKATLKLVVTQLKDKSLKLNYEDDGKGVDLTRLAQKAVQLNLISEEEIARMSDEQKMALLFQEGLSIADTVDQYAGRGHGMPLIKSIIEKHAGTVKLEQQQGKGFQLEIILPAENEPVLNELIA